MLCGGGLSKALSRARGGGPRVGQRGPRVRACKVKPGCVGVADADKASNGRQNLSVFSVGKRILCVMAKQPQPGCRGPALGGSQREREFSKEARWLSQCRGAWAQGDTWNTPMGAASWPLR